ncbi:hypothetical protein [Pseudanabaena sp. PCC 6802]|nr:hypothetical protein [Pseudanabaena sp. PCC 6802]
MQSNTGSEANLQFPEYVLHSQACLDTRNRDRYSGRSLRVDLGFGKLHL